MGRMRDATELIGEIQEFNLEFEQAYPLTKGQTKILVECFELLGLKVKIDQPPTKRAI